jgi:hypothetical protein
VDKDWLKGLLIVVVAVVAVSGLFIAVSGGGQRKAECIAAALKAGVAYGNIEKVCKLTQRS